MDKGSNAGSLTAETAGDRGSRSESEITSKSSLSSTGENQIENATSSTTSIEKMHRELCDEGFETPSSIIPKTWTKEMQDFYCTIDEEEFDHQEVLKRLPSDRHIWKADHDQDESPPLPPCNKCLKSKCTCLTPIRPLNCIYCGEEGHSSSDGKCKYPKCLNCGEKSVGKMVTRCDKCAYRPKSTDPIKCNICRLKRHLEETCPDNWRRYHSTTVDIQELVNRVEAIRKEMENTRNEMAGLNLTAAETRFENVRDGVLKSRRLMVESSSPSSGDKLKLLEDTETEMTRATIDVNKKRYAFGLGQNALHFLQQKAIELETLILKNKAHGPEANDQMSQEGGKKQRVNSKFLNSCCNCGATGHHSFKCPADGKWNSYVANKTWVIREQEPSNINLTLPLVSETLVCDKSTVTSIIPPIPFSVKDIPNPFFVENRIQMDIDKVAKSSATTSSSVSASSVVEGDMPNQHSNSPGLPGRR